MCSSKPKFRLGRKVFILMAISHFVVTLVDRMMTWVYEKSDGRLGSRLGKMGMLVLQTTGRKSDRSAVTPCSICLMEPGMSSWPAITVKIVIQAGITTSSALLTCASRLDAEQDALATVAGPEEYAQLWPRLIAQNPPWEAYARRTTRTIPVVILHPLA